MLRRSHRDQRGQSLVIVLSLITILFLLGSSLAVHASVALRSTRTSAGQGNDFYAADAATELGIWWQRNGKAGNPPGQTINGITTSTTITTAGGGGGSCPADPTPIWLGGFEHGVLSSSGGGLFSLIGNSSYTFVTAAAARTGSYGLRIQNFNASNYGYAQPKAGMPGAIKVARFAVKLPSLPSPNVDLSLALLGSSTDPNGVSLGYKASSQKLTLSIGSTATVEAATTITPGTWYGIDIRFDISTNPRKADWQIDGAAQTQVTFATAAGTDITTLQFGASGGNGATSFDVYFDDVAISATSGDYPFGELKVLALKPNAMGTNSPATPNAYFKNNDSTDINATSWQRVDEIPVNGTSDFIKQISKTTGGEYVEFSFEDTTETCIRGASVRAGLRAQTGAPTAAVNTVMNGSVVTIWSGSLSTTQIYGGSALSTLCCPLQPGVGPWTQAGINGVTARFGMSGNASATKVASVDTIMLEYGYRPMTGGPATVTIVGTGGASTVSTSYLDAGAGVPSLTTWTTTK